MNRGRRNRTVRGGTSGNGDARLAMRITTLEHKLNGRKTIPQDNPPAYVALPWNSFTYERTQEAGQAGAVQSTTVQDVLAQVAARVCLADTPPRVADVRVKVLGCQTWGIVGGTLLVPEILAEFFELSGETVTTQRPRSSQRDIGTLQKPAKAGYVFPIQDQREIVADDNVNLRIANVTAIYAGMNLTTRIQVLWQSSPTPN